MPSFSPRRREIARLESVRRAVLSSVMIVATAGCTILSGVADLEATRDTTDGNKADGSGIVGQPGADGSVVAPTDATTTTEDVVTKPPIDAGTDVVVGTKSFCDNITAFACFDYEAHSVNLSTAQHVNSTISIDGPGRD